MSQLDHSTVKISRAPLPRPVWVLSWVSFFADVSSEIIYPILPLFLVGVLGSSKLELGAMEGCAAFLVACLSAYAGIRSDRGGLQSRRVPWIRWGYGLPVLGKLLIALSTSWPLALGGRLFDRFGKGLRGAPRDALIADAVTAEQRGQAFGLHRAFDTAGALLGVLLAALLLWWLTGTPVQGTPDAAQVTETPAWIFRAIFIVGSALGLASWGLAFLVEESPEHESSQGPIPADEPASPTTPAATRPAFWSSLPNSYWLVLGILMLFSLANSSDTFVLLRASELGYEAWSVVLLYAFYNALYAVLSYPVGLLSDRLGRWRIMAAGWAIYAAVYAGFALLPQAQAWGMWPLMGLYGMYMALTDGVGKALIADHTPRDRRGTAMGLYYGLTGLTSLVASALAGLLWDDGGSAPALWLGAGMALLALAAVILLRNKLKSSAARRG